MSISWDWIRLMSIDADYYLMEFGNEAIKLAMEAK
jgi:hypothetical protein